MQDVEKIARFLQTVPMFHTLQDRQLRHLARRFTERSYATNETIVNQGTLGIGLFIIETGKADVVRERPDGDKAVVNKLGPTDFFGELSLLDDAPRTASVIATEPTTCLILTQLDFLSALHEDVDIPIILLRVLARRFRLYMENL
jgi:CRP-like cAMP-binding protein